MRRVTHQTGWVGWYLAAIIVAGCVIVGPIWFYRQGGTPTRYETSRVACASLSAGIAAFVAVIALVQYRRNSQNARVERSMSFWQRSNTTEFTDHLKEFVKHWVALKAKAAKPPNYLLRPSPFLDFAAIARSDDESIDVKLHIEYLLDFYDEACAGVIMGACDEAAMYFYLGPLMQHHAEALGEFIDAWREKHGREERWDCFTLLTLRWERQRPQSAARFERELKREKKKAKSIARANKRAR